MQYLIGLTLAQEILELTDDVDFEIFNLRTKATQNFNSPHIMNVSSGFPGSRPN